MLRFSTRLASLIFSILLVSNCSGSNSQSADEALQKQIESLTSQIDSLNNVINSSSTSSVVPAEATPNPLAIEQFSWAEVSDRVNALQDLLGVEKTGAYDDATWWSHVAYLVDFQLDTSIAPTPPVRDNPKISEPAGSPGSTQPAVETVREGGPIFNRCGECGQGFSQGNCSNWLISVTNSSNEVISSLTFAPPSGSWRDRDSGYGESEITSPADVSSRTINSNLAPWATNQFSFQICTTTPAPVGNFEFSVVAPTSVGFVWSDGKRSNACYNLGCY